MDVSFIWSLTLRAQITTGMLNCDVIFAKLLAGDGTAVLIRALEPTEGLDTMQKNRGLAHKGDKVKLHELCSGPSKLTKVFVYFFCTF